MEQKIVKLNFPGLVHLQCGCYVDGREQDLLSDKCINCNEKNIYKSWTEVKSLRKCADHNCLNIATAAAEFCFRPPLWCKKHAVLAVQEKEKEQNDIENGENDFPEIYRGLCEHGPTGLAAGDTNVAQEICFGCEQNIFKDLFDENEGVQTLYHMKDVLSSDYCIVNYASICEEKLKKYDMKFQLVQDVKKKYRDEQIKLIRSMRLKAKNKKQ